VRAEENFARRRAADLATLPKKTSHVTGLQTSPRFAPFHTPTRTEENFATRPPTRAEESLAVTPGCRTRAPDAKARGRCLENLPWNVKNPFPWVSKGVRLGQILRVLVLKIAYLEVK